MTERSAPRPNGRPSAAPGFVTVARAFLVAWLPIAHLLVQASTGPAIALPEGLDTFDIGGELSADGVPVRLRGFVSSKSAAALADEFRTFLGAPLVESQLGAQRVLGRGEGDHYLSVQIEPAGSGSRGIVAVSDLKAAGERRGAYAAARAQWLARLPAGSRWLGQTDSRDGGRHSRHLIFSNAAGETANRDRLVELLRDDGLALEREGGAHSAGLEIGRVLFFKGAGQEAIATVRRDPSGVTTVVLNLVTAAPTP